MPRDRFGASNIGTFACHTFPRDTKASKRAKSSLDFKLHVMKLNAIIVFLICSTKLFSQPFTTNNPTVGFSNCSICKIKQVIVDKDFTKILLEIKAQPKGQPWVSISPWTALAPYESMEQLAALRKLDIEIPTPTSGDATYLSLWRDLADQRKAMQADVRENANLVIGVEGLELGTKYNIKSKDPNQVFHFWLKFEPLPMGIEELMMIELTENGWEFGRIKITNPDTSPRTNWTEESIKSEWTKNGINYIEGIYEKAGSDEFSPKYKVAVKKNQSDGDYTLVYLSGADSKLWKIGDVKAKLLLTASENLYKTIWYMGNKSTVEDVYTSFDKGMMKLTWTDKRPEELYIKLFPTTTTDYPNGNNKSSSSGTGFALSESGYIVTNHHVIQGASKIKVRGVKGDFSKTYEAKLIIEDKNNDIAIIKIDDSNFTSLGTPPYKISSGIADVGVSVYALGYPLRATMGDEVKLTNGIVSSKTGYQGDITAYQVSVPVQPGNSGGPLLDSKGNIIGLINAKHSGAENASYAIKTTYLMNLIQAMNEMPTLPASNTISSKGLSDQVKFVKEFVYIIETN